MRYVKTSSPSFAAACDNLPRSGTQRRMIFDAIRESPEHGLDGLTRDELEVITGLSGNAVRPRVRELEDAGLVRETQETRKTRSGSQAAVLVVNVGSSTEGRDQAGDLKPRPVDATLGVASGVERPGTSSPSGGAPPANPYEYEVWA